jgi:membrane fusion protein (multidrug efflux system)
MAERDPQIELDESQPVAATGPQPKPRPWRKLALMGVVPLLVLVGGLIYWQGLQGKVSTDNAYVQQDKVSVSTEVGGEIVAVAVRENQQVAAGDLLFRIDPEPYRIQIAQADAAIANAQAEAVALGNSAALSGADIAGAREDIGFAQANLERQAALWRKGFTTKAAYEAAQH